MKIVLPAEWEEQAFVQLTWPTANTDWAPYLDEAIVCYEKIAEEIRKREPLFVFRGDINDTWARDHGFITTRSEEGKLILNDFQFNGWGMKFAANYDNQINSQILQTSKDEDINEEDKCFGEYFSNANYNNCLKIVLEGGSIESDGKGTILTTEDCLMAPNRNNFESRDSFEQIFKETFGAERVLWLNNVGLTGDDTDSHIDTIARLCPNDTIIYIYEDTDRSSQSYGLKSLKKQLEAIRTAEGKPYRLLQLPMPRPVVYEEEILPATYANFLIVNGAVLVPTYGQPDKDQEAIEIIQQAFPDHEIVGIDCQVLVKQHGSLHCVTMQFPKA